MDCSFRFVASDLNRRLIDLLQKADANCKIDSQGVIHYSSSDVELIENEIICRVRRSAFSLWQIVCCPIDWVDSYKQYMRAHRVPFVEELSDGELSFLIPRKYRPHAWKLEAPRRESSRRQVG